MAIELDIEVANGITLATLKENMEYLKKELDEHRNGAWMHPEDAYNSEFVLIPALTILIDYYGG